MICPNCGRETSGELFCGGCGSYFEVSGSLKSAAGGYDSVFERTWKLYRTNQPESALRILADFAGSAETLSEKFYDETLRDFGEYIICNAGSDCLEAPPEFMRLADILKEKFPDRDLCSDAAEYIGGFEAEDMESVYSLWTVIECIYDQEIIQSEDPAAISELLGRQAATADSYRIKFADAEEDDYAGTAEACSGFSRDLIRRIAGLHRKSGESDIDDRDFYYILSKESFAKLRNSPGFLADRRSRNYEENVQEYIDLFLE